MKNLRKYRVLLLFMILVQGCAGQTEKGGRVEDSMPKPVRDSLPSPSGLVREEGTTLEGRIVPPAGFVRVPVDSTSFGAYLRRLPLLPHGSPVLYYDGRVKSRRSVHVAVVDLDVGRRDLQQCADAVIRLWSEHLWQRGDFDRIHFNFTNGFRADYSRWRSGDRIRVSGNQVSWYAAGRPSGTYASFRQYLDMVFAYAGTLSLEQELEPADLSELRAGDVFIQGGSPGHAVTVVDLARHPDTGETLFLLAQSYMPAQQIHILENLHDDRYAPWYAAGFSGALRTPEWTFEKEDLRRFPEE